MELDTECEVIACEVELPKGPSLVLLIVCRPPYDDLPYMEDLCDILSRVFLKYKNSAIWIAGDFNLPNINWSNNSVSGYNYPSYLCNTF